MPPLPNAYRSWMSLLEAGWRLRIARWASGKEDEGPGRQIFGRDSKMAVREARKRAIQAKRPPGKPKKRPGNQNRRPDGEKRVRDGKKGAGNLRVGHGSPTLARGGPYKVDHRLLDARERRRRGSLTSEVRQGDGTPGRPPGVGVST